MEIGGGMKVIIINKIIKLFVVALIASILIGCNSITFQSHKIEISYSANDDICYDSTDITESMMDNNANSDCFDTSYSFLGVWLLEEVVVRPTFFWDWNEDGYSYSIPIDTDVYIGHKMEFSLYHVKLGDRIMTYPIYELSETGMIFSVSYHQEMLQRVFGHFDSVNQLKEKGLEVVFIWDEYFVRLDRINIRYPEYPQLWFRGYYQFDPLLDGLYEFHPLFREIVILDEDLILIGWRERILARRIN